MIDVEDTCCLSPQQKDLPGDWLHHLASTVTGSGVNLWPRFGHWGHTTKLATSEEIQEPWGTLCGAWRGSPHSKRQRKGLQRNGVIRTLSHCWQEAIPANHPCWQTFSYDCQKRLNYAIRAITPSSPPNLRAWQPQRFISHFWSID